MGTFATTYLLGAGFSRSICNLLPLSCDFFERIRSTKIGQTSYFDSNPSLQSLDRLVQEYFPSSPDLEEVLSFLNQRYFAPGLRQHWQHRQDAYTELLNLVANRYGSPMTLELPTHNILGRFANKLISAGSNVLTFNYDCILDSFLLNTGEWNCASGYGLPLRHICDCFHNALLDKAPASSMSVLKLHGSVNWGIPHMNRPDAQLQEVFFIQPDLAGVGCNVGGVGVTLPLSRGSFHSAGFQPFIVPPIVDKGLAYETPILRRIWYLAREVISASDRIVILGYSFPPTDYMARFLFKEAFGMFLASHREREVIVVNSLCDNVYKRRVETLMTKSTIEFVEDDAIAYVEKHCQEAMKTSDRPNTSIHYAVCDARMPFAERGALG